MLILAVPTLKTKPPIVILNDRRLTCNIFDCLTVS